MIKFIVPVFLLILATFSFNSNMRKAIFGRDKATCQSCGRTWDEGYMLECHHVDPLSCGGSNTIDNGKLLCRDCHKEAHIRLSKSSDTKQKKNANAYAARLIQNRINDKGVKRYGY